MLVCVLEYSNIPTKKFKVTIMDPITQTKKIVHFGAKNYSDYTIHKDYERMQRYTLRHKSRENWNRSGIYTAGFWSKHLLWSKPSLNQSIKYMQEKFKIKIKKQL